MGKVYAQYSWLTLSSLAMKSKCHVASAAAQIHHTGVRSGEDVSEGLRGAPPPQMVDIEREEMIEKVVTERDVPQHFVATSCCCNSLRGVFRRSASFVALVFAGDGSAAS